MDKISMEKGLTPDEMKALMDLSECAMFTAHIGSDIEVRYANQTFYSRLQYTPEEFLEKCGGSLMGVIVPEEKQKVRNLIARQSAAGGVLQLEFRVQRKDGAKRWVSFTAQTIGAQGTGLYYCSALDITQQKYSLDEIYNAKREVELLMNSGPGGIIKVRTSDFYVLYANEVFFQLSGYSRMEYRSLFGNYCNAVVYQDDVSRLERAVQLAVENKARLSFEYRIVAKNGEIRWSYVTACRADDQDGEIVYLCIIVDITAKKQLEEKIADNLRRSEYLLQFMKKTAWTYRVAEKKLYRSGYLKGTYSTEEEIQNLFNKETIKEYVHLDDVESLLGNLLERVEQPGHNRGVYRIKDAKGDYRSFEINMISVAAEGGNKPDVIYGETLLVEDNSYMLEQGAAQEPASRENIAGKILNIARTARARFEDDVTALMSYEDFVEAVQEQLKNRKKEKNYGLLCCDINGFQRLTYHYGISVGDEVLKSFAELLKKHMAYKNLCSRISGDYFVAFFDYEQHTQLLKKISYMLQVQDGIEKKQSYSLNGTTSGIYLIQDEDNDITEMLEKADLARRSIKGIRGNHYAIYTDDLENSRFREVEVLQQIEDSLLEHTIEVCYLPRISGNKENVIGCKAVPRVPLKDGDYLELEDLHRYLDRSERVQQLVFYVLSVVCSNMGAWKANGKKIMPVSLDITFGQLCMQNAVNKIDEIVKANKLEPADIVLEVQEQYFADLTAKIELALRDLSTRGYRVIISRFGSDHTAVHSIRRLPVAGIKFHGEYFRENLRSEKEKIIFQKLVEMAQELGMEVACGGIKTKLQEDAARLIGCDILEGDIYYGTMQSDVYEKCFLNN